MRQALNSLSKRVDIHAFVAAQVYGVGEDEVTYEMRRVAKIVNFSLIYGKTAYGLSQATGMPIAESLLLT